MSTLGGPKIIQSGLVISIDAGDRLSYPRSGVTIYDTSGNNYHHNLNCPFNIIDNVECFDVSNGGTSWNVELTSTTYTFTASHTMIAWARPLSDAQATTWRTLFRTQPDDHPLLIEDGTNNIGYFDNNAAIFVSYGLNAGTLGIENKWTMFTLVGSGTSTTLYINGTSSSGTVAYNASGNRHYTIGSTSGAAVQPFGYIACTQIYNRSLTTAEIQQNFNSTRGRFKV